MVGRFCCFSEKVFLTFVLACYRCKNGAITRRAEAKVSSDVIFIKKISDLGQLQPKPLVNNILVQLGFFQKIKAA